MRHGSCPGRGGERILFSAPPPGPFPFAARRWAPAMRITVSSAEIIEVLANSLDQILADLCVKRYGGPLRLHRIPDRDPKDAPVGRFQIEQPGLHPMRVKFTVSFVGGNVYEVRAKIGESPARSFLYGLTAGPRKSSDRAPHLARAVADYLLDEMERQLGASLLRQHARQQDAASEPANRRPTKATSK